MENLLNCISIDYLTITVRNKDLAEILFDMGLLNIKFQTVKGHNFYKECMTFSGINILYNGINANMGICIELKGAGCRAFETFGNGDYLMLFRWVLECEENNCTRLDLAFDDFTGILPLETIRDYAIAGNYISKCKGGNIRQGFGNQDGLTVYFGSRDSEFLIRFYDKAAEKCVKDTIPHWVRCEMQLGKSLTYKTLQDMVSYDDIKATFFKVLNNYLRFVEPCESENKSRDSVVSVWWSEFVGNYGKKSVFTKKGIEYNENNLKRYVFGQAGGALWTYLQIHDIDDFFKELQYLEKKEKNPKYLELLKKYEIYQTASGGSYE